MKKVLNDPFKIGEDYDWRKKKIFYDTGKTFYAAFCMSSGGFRVFDLDSQDFKALLLREYTTRAGEFPSDYYLESLVKNFKGEAVTKGDCYKVHLRTASYEDGVVIDLINDSCTAAIVKPGNVKIGAPGCFFRRTPSMEALPEPDLNGQLTDLFNFIPVASEKDRKVLIAWIVSAIMISDSYPVLVLQGMQGAAKSSTARFIKAIIDPSSVPLTPMSSSDRDLMIGAANSRLIVFDNLRTVKSSISDLLCGLSTGSGFRTRKLYSNVDEIAVNVCLPVILTGIHSLITEPDLLDRSVIIDLPPVNKANRKSLNKINAEFEKARPGIFGGLLSCLSRVLEILPTVELKESPRMADFARVGVAVEKALNWPEGSFLKAYLSKIDDAIVNATEDEPLFHAVVSLLDLKGSWLGTATELKKSLSVYCSVVSKTPRVISANLRSMAEAFERLGIVCEFDINKGKIRRGIRLSRKESNDSCVMSEIGVETAEKQKLDNTERVSIEEAFEKELTSELSKNVDDNVKGFNIKDFKVSSVEA